MTPFHEEKPEKYNRNLKGEFVCLETLAPSRKCQLIQLALIDIRSDLIVARAHFFLFLIYDWFPGSITRVIVSSSWSIGFEL